MLTGFDVAAMQQHGVNPMLTLLGSEERARPASDGLHARSCAEKPTAAPTPGGACCWPQRTASEKKRRYRRWDELQAAFCRMTR